MCLAEQQRTWDEMKQKSEMVTDWRLAAVWSGRRRFKQRDTCDHASVRSHEKKLLRTDGGDNVIRRYPGGEGGVNQLNSDRQNSSMRGVERQSDEAAMSSAQNKLHSFTSTCCFINSSVVRSGPHTW